MAVFYSSIKHHKLKRRVELKERKILEILKTILDNSNDNSRSHTKYSLMYNFIAGFFLVGNTSPLLTMAPFLIEFTS